ncbi:MAG: SUMF1/EgtB/PvdO family nonheme iron enzyme, partial [Prosthecobacter sp.]|nr:SUMF1/EgtB/PvdO family nonheme iron enzyme [Prosthecobacter sp.]
LPKAKKPGNRLALAALLLLTVLGAGLFLVQRGEGEAGTSSDIPEVRASSVTASPIQWQKAGWTEEDLRNKTLLADGDWARIGQKAGASNGWRIGANGETVSFKDGVVRLRYRWEGEMIVLKTRNEKTFGKVQISGSDIDLGIYLRPAEGRLFQKVILPQSLKIGDEGTLEIAAIGNCIYARLNDTIVLSSPEIPELSPSGYCGIQSENASFRNIEYAILDGIPEPLKALGWEVPLNWQKAVWSENEVAEKKLVVEDSWARIGMAAGALEKTWKLAGDGSPISLGDGAVRLRYRFEGRAVTLKIRNHTTFGYVTLGPSRLDLGIWSTSYAEREKRVQTRTLATPLKDGEEGVLELAAVGRRLFCRLNETIVLSSEELSDLGLTGGCQIQSDGVSFRDVEYLHFGGIADPLKALGWGGASPASATMEAPFVNSLGMKFVPVPITGGPTDGKRVLFSIWETRVRDYEVFAKETKREWPKPDFEQGPTHPAVNVSWTDANAFCAWLTDRERKAGNIDAKARYRLPGDHEWSCAVTIAAREDAAMLPSEKHAKLKTEFPWGGAWPPPAESGNFSGEETVGIEANKPTQLSLTGYRDEFIATAPVGSFPQGPYGIFDLSGNVWEWCEDWFDHSQTTRVLRGNAWDGGERGRFLSSSRTSSRPAGFAGTYGFRCVLALESASEAAFPSVTSLPSTPATATKDALFENSLGMKFVPVPITGGPTDKQRVLFSIWVTRVQDYAAYAAANPQVDGSWKIQHKDGIPVGREPDHPVVNV